MSQGGWTQADINEGLAAAQVRTYTPAAAPASQIVNAKGPEPAILSQTAIAYAGFWNRLMGMILDGFILSAGALAVGILAIFLSHDKTVIEIISSLVFVASILYYIAMEASAKQATLGKMIMGIKVVDLNGNKISGGRSTGRFFSKYISSIFLVGFIMQPFTQKKQALHDMIAGTLVIKTAKASTGKAILVIVGWLVIVVSLAIFFVIFLLGSLFSGGLSSVKQLETASKNMATSTTLQDISNSPPSDIISSTTAEQNSIASSTLQTILPKTDTNNSSIVSTNNTVVLTSLSSSSGKPKDNIVIFGQGLNSKHGYDIYFGNTTTSWFDSDVKSTANGQLRFSIPDTVSPCSLQDAMNNPQKCQYGSNPQVWINPGTYKIIIVPFQPGFSASNPLTFVVTAKGSY